MAVRDRAKEAEADARFQWQQQVNKTAVATASQPLKVFDDDDDDEAMDEAVDEIASNFDDSTMVINSSPPASPLRAYGYYYDHWPPTTPLPASSHDL